MPYQTDFITVDIEIFNVHHSILNRRLRQI